MPCNTAHYFAPAVIDAVKIPFISIVESTVAEIKANFPDARRILPIATIGTKTGRVYENVLLREGYEAMEMPEDIQAEVMYAIYDGVKKGQTAEVLPAFKKTLERIEAELKPDLMIAACTEIPILMEHITTKTPTVDATMALARAAVKFAKSSI
jgi:aspartate racemase